MEKERKRIGHLVLVPCPFQGHMNPMLHLANLLHSKGFSITIIHTKPNSPNPSHYPDFIFESIGRLSDDQDPPNGDFVPFLLSLNSMNGAPFRDCLERLQSDTPRGPTLCVIHDAAVYFPAAVADELKIPRIVLRTSSAAAYVGFSLLKKKGRLPNQEHQLEEPLVDFPKLRFKDLPEIKTSPQEGWDEFLAGVDEGTRTGSSIIWNTLCCLEQTTLEKIEEELLIPNFPIGPLHKHCGESWSRSLTEDHSCIAWLDTQAPGSVIYVSIGSLITISENELVEMSWGLANSTDQPFLWVVRPGSINGSSRVELLLKEFKERTSKRGLVIEWAPQQKVLAHPSIGGFWTHNGWNSTLESISAGVPMLCWPCAGDQKVNARFVSHVWRVGIQLEDGLDREKIEKAIRRLMVDEEGVEIRKRAMELKKTIEFSLNEGGPSYGFLDQLVGFIMSGPSP